MFDKIKLYLFPILLGSIGAVISALLKLSTFTTVIVALLLWLSGVLLSYKEPVPKSPEKDDMTFEEYMNYTQRAIKHLQQKARLIEDKNISDKISNISFNIEKIAAALNKDPVKFTKNRKIFSYYIPATINLIDKYDEIEDQELTSKNSVEYMKKVEDVIITLDTAYKNMLNNVYEFDILDSSADVQVLSDLLKMEGLKNE